MIRVAEERPPGASRLSRAQSRESTRAAEPRRVSPEWQEYLHAEAERVRALGAAALAGAPVPKMPPGTEAGPVPEKSRV